MIFDVYRTDMSKKNAHEKTWFLKIPSASGGFGEPGSAQP
jgi:hypothetical protein